MIQSLVRSSLQLLRHLRLDDLALDRVLGIGDVEVADELLGDRRATLAHLAGLDVLDRGADHRLDVDAVVLVEVLVLDRDRRLLQGLGHVLGVDPLADRVGLDVAEARAVGGEDDRGLALVDRLQLVDRGGRGGGIEDPDADAADAGGDRRDHDPDREQDLLARRTAVAALPSPLPRSHRPSKRVTRGVPKPISPGAGPGARIRGRRPREGPRGHARGAWPLRRRPGCGSRRAGP